MRRTTVHLVLKRVIRTVSRTASGVAAAVPGPQAEAQPQRPASAGAPAGTPTAATTPTPPPVAPTPSAVQATQAANSITPPTPGPAATAAAGDGGVRPTGEAGPRRRIIRRIVKKKKHHHLSTPSATAAAEKAAGATDKSQSTAAPASAASAQHEAVEEAAVSPPAAAQPAVTSIPSDVAAAAATAAKATVTTGSRTAVRPEPVLSEAAAKGARKGQQTVAAAAAASSEEAARPTPTHAKAAIKTVAKEHKEQSAGATTTLPAASRIATGKDLYNELRGFDQRRESGEAGTTGRHGGRGRKTAMVKAFRVDEILSVCDESDALFARRLPTGGCQFFAWPGTPLAIASAAIVSMPDTIRTVHSVFGRSKVPIDLVLDIDCPVPQEHWSMSKIRPFQMKILDGVLTVVTRELAKLGEEVATQVVLQSPNLKKASFHVHTKLKDAAFADYESLHGFLYQFRDEIPHVDLQIYRPNGMLRMFSCMKENRTSAMVVFDDPKWNIGFPDGRVPDAAAALHSVCIREAGTFSRVLKFEAPRLGSYAGGAAGAGHEQGGASVKGTDYEHRPAVLLPRTELEAVTTASRWLRSATEAEVTEWRSWIALGLCAFRIGHHFNDAKSLPRPAMQEMLDAWVEASRHCPAKFRSGDCEARWATFDSSKIDPNQSWWGAYRHLGNLTVPMQEAMAREREQERQRGRGRYSSSGSASSESTVTSKASQSNTP